VGAVACLGLALLTGCSAGPLEVDAPAAHGQDAQACRALLGALPKRVDDQRRRRVDAGGGYAAAWGDPAIELRCGVRRPKGLTKFATCQVTNRVGWFIPASEITGQRHEIVMTTVGRAQYVEVRIPEQLFPPAPTMADLAPSIRGTIRQVHPCV
jgi:hypothetical protein